MSDSLPTGGSEPRPPDQGETAAPPDPPHDDEATGEAANEVVLPPAAHDPSETEAPGPSGTEPAAAEMALPPLPLTSAPASEQQATVVLDKNPTPATADTAADVTDEAPPPRRQLRSWQMALLTLLAVGFLVGAFLLGGKGGSDEPGATSPTTVAIPKDFVKFSDPKTGVSLSYPKGWTKLEAADEEIRFAAQGGDGGSLLVRVSELGVPVGADNLADAKAFTDGILKGDGRQIIRERALSLNGMPAFYYLYNFTDQASAQEGVHAHYFVFRGRQMTALVFQALPTAKFTPLAPLFDKVATSFNSTAAIEAPTASTTAPPASDAPPESTSSIPPASAPSP